MRSGITREGMIRWEKAQASEKSQTNLYEAFRRGHSLRRIRGRFHTPASLTSKKTGNKL